MSRFHNRNFELLEPYDAKVSRTVLRGEGSSNAPDLLDYNGDNRAGFIKALFPKAFADTDTSTIKNFKVEPLKTEIPIDEPENGKLDFHYPEDYVRN